LELPFLHFGRFNQMISAGMSLQLSTDILHLCP
jgi:hypothetical protein